MGRRWATLLICIFVLEAVTRAGSLSAGDLAAEPAAAAAVLDPDEESLLGLINQYRTENGVGALTIDPSINNAADWMSLDMGVNDYFAHIDSLGRDPFQRMTVFGYDYNTWKGENLAAGTSSAQIAFALWKGSPGHNANMLRPEFKVIGISRAYTAGSSYGWYWTNDFGGYVAESPDADGDGVPDGADNCPTTANALQTNTDVSLAGQGARLGAGNPPPLLTGDVLGDACDPDADNDSSPDAVEAAIGTNPLDNCFNGPGSGGDAWPLDNTADGSVNALDIIEYRGKIPGAVDTTHPKRLDLDDSGFLDVSDLLLYRGKIPSGCA